MVIVLLPDISRAKDTLNWQKVNWPPYQILQGEDAGKGKFDVYIKLFQEQLPQYNHQNIELNWSRFWIESVILGSFKCMISIVNFIKTGEKKIDRQDVLKKGAFSENVEQCLQNYYLSSIIFS